MSEIRPPTPRIQSLSHATIQVAPTQIAGRTATGEQRVVQILSGRFEGRVNADVLPGGADRQTVMPDGTTYLDARYMIRTDDGAVIQVRNLGLRHGALHILQQLAEGETVDPSNYYFRTTTRFETGDERYLWLNKIVAICSGARTPNAVLLDFYEVL